MTYDNPTTDSSPENLLLVCAGLDDGGRSLDELQEDDDLDLSNSVISANVKYGVRLDFITEKEDRYELTDAGWEAALADEVEESLQDEFQKGVQAHPLYSDLISKIFEDSLVGSRESGAVTQKQILSQLNRNFGFTELSTENTLKPAANVFLKTLEAAGYGEYVIGRGSKPTRLKVNDLFKALESKEGSTKSNKEAKQEQKTVQPTLEDSTRTSNSGAEKIEYNEIEVEDDANPQSSGQESSRRDNIELTKDIRSDNGVILEINIEISSADWDSEQVVDLINVLQSEE